MRAVSEAQRDTVGAASSTAGDTLTGSVNLTLSSAGFITFSFLARRDLRSSVTSLGDKSNVSIMDIFSIACNAASPAGCATRANADGIVFQFAPDGDANNGSDVNGNHATGSRDPFSLNMTAGTNDPGTARAFTNNFALFSLTSNFALPAGSYTLNFSKSTRTDIVVIQQVPEPAPCCCWASAWRRWRPPAAARSSSLTEPRQRLARQLQLPHIVAVQHGRIDITAEDQPQFAGGAIGGDRLDMDAQLAGQPARRLPLRRPVFDARARHLERGGISRTDHLQGAAGQAARQRRRHARLAIAIENFQPQARRIKAARHRQAARRHAASAPCRRFA